MLTIKNSQIEAFSQKNTIQMSLSKNIFKPEVESQMAVVKENNDPNSLEGTRCEETAKKLYPKRYKALDELMQEKKKE